MVWFKSCPRCHKGDIALDRDLYGWYLQCLQCSYTKDIATPAEAERVLHMLRLSAQERELVAKLA